MDKQNAIDGQSKLYINGINRLSRFSCHPVLNLGRFQKSPQQVCNAAIVANAAVSVRIIR